MSINHIKHFVFRNIKPSDYLSKRLYGRWMHRNPAKVILPFEPNSNTNLKQEKIIDLNSEFLVKNSSIKNKQSKKNVEIKVEEKKQQLPNSKHIIEKREDSKKKTRDELSQKKVFDENNEIVFEKLKKNDSQISMLMVKLKSRKGRLRSGQVFVEGWRMIVEGLLAKCSLNYIIFSRIQDLNNLRPFLPKTGVQIFKIPYDEIAMWSDLETSPGIIGIFQIPSTDHIVVHHKPLPLQIICDNIRVPGNLGAILRVAVGAGCEKVILSKGCVDVFDPKVIRSGAGAHFRLPIHHSISWEDMPNHLANDTSVFIADCHTQLHDTTQSNKIITHEMPLLPYYGVEFPTLKNITLIIGGETEGISDNSFRLAAELNGFRLNIPLQEGVDSLNSGMAAAVIAFEIKKQFVQAAAKNSIRHTVQVS